MKKKKIQIFIFSFNLKKNIFTVVSFEVENFSLTPKVLVQICKLEKTPPDGDVDLLYKI